MGTSGTYAIFREKPTLTIKANDATKTYDGLVYDGSAGYTAPGAVNGDTFPNSTLTYSSTSTNAGNSTFTPSNFTNNPGYDITYQVGNLTVNPAPLTVTADDFTRVYGDPNPVFTATYTGLKNGESGTTVAPVTLETSATSASTVQGSPYPISIGATAGTTASENYTVSYLPGDLMITKAPLTVTAVDISREYGEENPALTAHYTGLKNGETGTTVAPVTLATSATSASTVQGSPYDITTEATPGGTQSENYAVDYQPGHLTVTPATLTVRPMNASRVYGEADPTWTLSYAGLRLGEKGEDLLNGLVTVRSNVDLTYPVGSYDWIVTGPGNLDNYLVQYAQGTLTVIPALLTVRPLNASRAYGEANPVFTFTYTGFKNGEDAGVVTQDSLIPSTVADASSSVGDYDITVSGGFAPNYTFAYEKGSLAVTKALLTVRAQDVSRVYGDLNPVFTVNYTGFKNSETENTSGVLTQAPETTTGATLTSSVGAHDITVSGGVAPNYAFVYEKGNLTVTKAPLIVGARHISRVYGEANPLLGPTYKGLKNNEIGATVVPVTLTTTAELSSIVGSYPITVAAEQGSTPSENYGIRYVTGDVRVIPAPLSVLAPDVTREYGEENPVFTPIYSGLQNQDTGSVVVPVTLTTEATSATAVRANAYDIDIVPTAGTTASSNYVVTYVKGPLTVTKAPLTVTAEGKVHLQNNANLPAFTFVYTGFKKGEDTITAGVTGVNATTPAQPDSSNGEYDITPYGGNSSNYKLTYVNGKLVIQ